MWTQIRLLFTKQSDLGLNCLLKRLLKILADDKFFVISTSLKLYMPVNIFSVMSGQLPGFNPKTG